MTIKKLSKSDYTLGLQCPLALWFDHRRGDLKPPITERQQALFDTGHEVGEYAKHYFEPGFEVNAPYWEVEAAMHLTKQAIANGYEAIFEATVQAPDGTYACIDILRKHPDGDWDLIEVKSSTKVRSEHIDDIGFQYYVFCTAGYKIRNCYLMLVNNEYVRDGEIDPKQFLKLHLVTDQAIAKHSIVQNVSVQLMEMLERNTPPEQDVGAHCKTPLECKYRSHCWKHVPKYSIFDLFNKNKSETIYKLYGVDIGKVPQKAWPRGAKQVDIHAFLKDEEYVDKLALKDFLQTLQYPLYFLDYETVSHAVPLFDGTCPYQQVPFQFSLHIRQLPKGELRHVEFLHRDKSDPRLAFVKALVEHCGKEGSVVVYNQSFEEQRNVELSEAFPHFANRISNITQRMVDLLIPFRNRIIYSPKQNGSVSIKATLPAFTNLSYESVEIAEGTAASRSYLNYQRGMLTPLEVTMLFEKLSKYCELDTHAMVSLLEVLELKESKLC